MPKQHPGDTVSASPASADEILKLGNQLCFPLYAAANLITRLYRPALDRLGLTYPQYLVMLVLWEKAPQNVSDLGACLYLDSGTLTPLLKRMESAKLITRTRDAADERRVQIALTPKGRKLKQDAYAIPAQICGAMGLPLDELIALRGTMQKLLGALARVRH